ncbi:MAG: hypothetical protein RSA50_02560 [Mucinivorans sp.]
MKILTAIIAVFTVLCCSAQVHKGFSSAELKSAQSKIYNRLGRYPAMFLPYKSQSERAVKLEKVSCSSGRVNLYFNQPSIQIGLREDILKQWEQAVRDSLGRAYSECKVGLFYGSTPLERYIPNFFRSTLSRDIKRTKSPKIGVPLVQQKGEMIYGKGLSYRHIALWPSHGKVYNVDSMRWEWQRPALFCTREDLHTFEYLDHYLIPMLENAGATLFSPRERDTQPLEIIIDNDGSSAGATFKTTGTWATISGGFKMTPVLQAENPFTLGSYLISNSTGSVEYSSPIVQPGQYAVYVSYHAATGNARVIYSVEHMGGVSDFELNQAIGGGWVYLGRFNFNDFARITLKGVGQFSADAVRLGGGMGNVQRGATVSGVARWAEAARYYMQYSGVPSSIYKQEHDTKQESDYMDDYKARGDWVTYLQQSQHLPIDVAVALHTNAGVVDTTFGTLTINYTNKGRDSYSSGQSKYAGRDLADIILTQVVGDIRALHCPTWTRRSMYDKSYAEVSRPDCPAVIVELLSHQNLNDMVLGLNPAFRFTAARAIYKGILKFLASSYGFSYAVEPLPVKDFALRVVDGSTMELAWQESVDKLEPTAHPIKYRVYTCVEGGDFDRGVYLEKPLWRVPIVKDNLIRSYKVVAVNDGGKSLDSEVLYCRFATDFKADECKTIILDNMVQAADTLPGGINLNTLRPYKTDRSIVGPQVNFDRSSPFIDNDHPGWGESKSTLEMHGVKEKHVEITNLPKSFIMTTVK